jgi:hypothetical protein
MEGWRRALGYGLLAAGLLACSFRTPTTQVWSPAPPPPPYVQALPQGGFLPPLAPPPVQDWSAIQPWASPLGLVPGPWQAQAGALLQGLGPQLNPLAMQLAQLAGQTAVQLGQTALVLTTPPGKRKQAGLREGCGHSVVQGEEIPLDCPTADYGLIPWAATVLFGDDRMSLSEGHSGSVPLPPEVDHRKTSGEGPTRNQGSVGSCTAFSLAAAIDNSLLSQGMKIPVSALHVWSRYHRPSMEAAARAVQEQVIAPESAVPYDQKQACSWGACNTPYPCAKRLRVECGRPVPEGFSRNAERSSTARVVQITRLNDRNVRSFLAPLAKGHDIWFAMSLDGDSFDGDELISWRGNHHVVPHFSARHSRSGHAILLAGYKMTPDGLLFLVHNSWGTGWGDGGYAWIHEKTLQENIYSAYLVEARPLSAPLPRPQTTECPDPLVPDSSTGECVPLCQDGSPRHGGVCSLPGQCPPGFTNLSGQCVVSPASKLQRDPASGVFWRCGAGGCSYIIPGGRWGCNRRWCSVSCPSPKYGLTVTPTGFSCSE